MSHASHSQEPASHRQASRLATAFFALVAPLTLVVGLQGCGSGDNESSGETSTTVAGPAPSARPADAGGPPIAQTSVPIDDYDPFAYELARRDDIGNREASVPSMCYTKTAGVANPCWTCHTQPVGRNEVIDWDLQEEYAFSDFALANSWHNLFVDRSEQIARITDQEVLEYIRQDNYRALRDRLAGEADYPGYRPDLDFDMGFDDQGFAVDGSGWRAFAYKPFLGTFWPTNGNTDDVLIRLPEAFQQDAQGNPSRDIYKINLAIVEAAIRSKPGMLDEDISVIVEPVDETLAGLDLDGNGQVGGVVTRINGLPQRFVGKAAHLVPERHLYPQYTEFLHSVRYVDPDAPGMLATRMKELRYMVKRNYHDAWSLSYQYERELNEKQEGKPPQFAGSGVVGLRNAFGWQLQGFIEDARGRLRVQSTEETRFCMGCHSAIGVTVDQTFSFARKVPGSDGWRYQYLDGMPDVPQAGHTEPEILTYFKRTTGGDEFRANDEILARFFPGGVLDEAEVKRAALGGDKDIRHLILPSRERALLLSKAYLALVRTQTFEQGRDTIISPPQNVHTAIENGETQLKETGKVFQDGKLWLEWPGE